MRPAFEDLANHVRSASGPAVERGAAEMAAAIRANAPVETGALRDTVRVTPARVDGRSAVAAVAIPINGGHREDNTNTVLHVEYGTSRTAANPFIRRSVAQVGGHVADQLGGAVGDAVRSR